MGETCRGGACGEGGGGGEACEECVQKCLLVHGRKNPSPIVTSFFKIIMDDLPKALFIPPRFARTIASLVNQETYLEDANGQRWKIYSRTGCEKFKISEKKNNIVKRKLSAKRPLGHLPSGGRKSSATKPLSPMFRSDSFHEQGSTSTVHSDFEAEIYENNSVVKDVEEHVTVAAETTSVCKNSKTTQSVQQEDCFEIPFYMFDRNAVDTQQEANRSSFFDLSNFEMIQSRPGADGRGTLSTVIKEEKFPCYDIDSVQPQTKEACRDISERKRKAKDGEELSFANEGILHFMDASKQPSTCSKNEKTNLNTPTKASRKYPSTKALNCMPEGTDKVIVQRGHTPAEKRHRSIPPVASMSRCPKNRSSTKEKDYYSGREPVAFEVKHEEKVKEKEGKPPVVVKMECEEIDNHLMKLEGQTLKVVKTESVDSVSLPAPIVVDFRISATAESQSFLELPTGLPSFTAKGRSATDRKVVLLRDPAMRKWPVLYHEGNGFRVFASGWEALARENNIQIGDICNVVLENESEPLLQIHIDRNPSLVN